MVKQLKLTNCTDVNGFSSVRADRSIFIHLGWVNRKAGGCICTQMETRKLQWCLGGGGSDLDYEGSFRATGLILGCYSSYRTAHRYKGSCACFTIIRAGQTRQVTVH